MDLVELRRSLEEHFNLDELYNLCADLKIEYENLDANTRQGIVRELVAYAMRNNRINELKSRCQELRPHVSWIQQRATLSEHEAKSPFKGLEFYDVEDADLFFGRSSLIDKLEKRLSISANEEVVRFLAVVGASGSGKSSLVRAGLVPRIQRNTNWLVHVITPSLHPVEELAIKLISNEESATAAPLIDAIAEDPRSLHLYCRKILKADERLLLIIDQFEELFIQCKEDAERKSFIDNLLYAVTPKTGSSVIVVITLRADFYHYCAKYDNLRQMLASRQEYIGTMGEAELREAILEPVKLRGWRYEEGLVNLILRDVNNEPGALPLLSHALDETWKRRNEQLMLMTHTGYQASGGVRGAIAQTAEETFSQLEKFQQEITRNILLRLTELGEGREGTRHRVIIDNLVTDKENADVNVVLESLVKARLITIDEKSVEIAHEALIREWPRLRQWLEEDREILRIHRQLTTGTQLWLNSGKDSDALYRGKLLRTVVQVFANYHSRLNQQEREFITSSLLAQETRRRDRVKTRQSFFKLQQIVAFTLGVALFVGGTIGGVVSLVGGTITDRVVEWSLSVIIGSIVVGLTQWFFYRKQDFDTGRWLLMGFILWCIGLIVGVVAGTSAAYLVALAGFITGGWLTLHRTER
jgi:hypothetical protein